MRLSAPSRPLLGTTDSIVVPPDRFAVTSSHVGDGTRPPGDLAAVHGEEPLRRPMGPRVGSSTCTAFVTLSQVAFLGRGCPASC